MTLAFKQQIDQPLWRPDSQPLAAGAAGQCMAFDSRNDSSRHPYSYLLRSATAGDAYNPITDEWLPLASPALTGTFGAGAAACFHTYRFPVVPFADWSNGSSGQVSDWTNGGSLGVGANQLADRGDGVGFRVRHYDLTNGLTEERTIIASTASATRQPVITVDPPFTNAPLHAASLFEFLSGQVVVLNAGSTTGGKPHSTYDPTINEWKSFPLSISAPASLTTDTAMLSLTEFCVPYDRKPGEGMVSGGATYDTSGTSKNCIQATAATATTITGSGMPSDLATDEYKNFQIRIVEDTTTPTAVTTGNISRITGHTSGANGVFTVSGGWVTTPSANAKFVIEYISNLYIRTSGSTNLWTNNGFWHNEATGGGAPGAGVMMAAPFGIPRAQLVAAGLKHGLIYIFRGGATADIDVFDMGALSYSANITYGNKGQTFTTGTCGAYDPITNGGRYFHINVNGTQRMCRFDLLNRVMETGTFLRQAQGAAVVGGRLAFNYTDDLAAILRHKCPTTQAMFSQVLQGY